MMGPRWARRAVSLGVVVAALMASGDASANARVAKRYFKKGEYHYRAGRFSSALAEYKKAYNAKSLPALLFNISQCHMELGQWEQAIFFYEGYLRDDPKTRNRKLVEDRIVEARRNLERERKAAAAKKPFADKRQTANGRRGSRGTRDPPGERNPGGSPNGAASAQTAAAGSPREIGSGTSVARWKAKAGARTDVGGGEAASAGGEQSPGASSPGDGGKPSIDTEGAVALAAQVDPLQSPDLDVKRSAEATPIYKKWWFWGVVGGVVVASAAATAYYFYWDRDHGDESCGGMPADWCVDLSEPSSEGASP